MQKDGKSAAPAEPYSAAAAAAAADKADGEVGEGEGVDDAADRNPDIGWQGKAGWEEGRFPAVGKIPIIGLDMNVGDEVVGDELGGVSRNWGSAGTK